MEGLHNNDDVTAPMYNFQRKTGDRTESTEATIAWLQMREALHQWMDVEVGTTKQKV